MNLVDRARNLCLTPRTEWSVIAGESATPAGLLGGYVGPLALIGSTAGLVGGTLVGTTLPFVGTYRVPILSGISMAIFTFVMTLVGVFALSWVIDLLAPSFGAQKSSEQALKLAAYSSTPALLASVLQIVPALAILGVVGAVYALYLLYLGLPRLMHCPEEKAAGYTLVVVVCAIVLWAVIAGLGTLFGGMRMMAAGAL
jgi:hypothetical protein